MDTCNSPHVLLNQVTYHIRTTCKNKHTIQCSGQGQVRETCIINNVLNTTYVIQFVINLQQVCHFLRVIRFHPLTAKILFKVALNTITLTHIINVLTKKLIDWYLTNWKTWFINRGIVQKCFINQLISISFLKH
jgi:hypothetical protein